MRVTPSEVIAFIGAYCGAHFVADGAASPDVLAKTADDLLDHLNELTMKSIPMASVQRSNRYKWDGPTNKFRYFGCQTFRDFVAEVDSAACRGRCRVVGASGAGKSHLIAAYVPYQHCLSILGLPGARNVVYIASCDMAAYFHMHYEYACALQIAYPDDADLQHEDLLAPNIDYVDRMYHYIYKHRNDRTLFVYDEWDYFLSDTSPAHETVRDWMLKFTLGQQRVEVLSPSNHPEYKWRLREAVHKIEIPAGLSDEEWSHWRTHFPLLAAIDSERLEQEVKYLTGCIPLYLSQICSYGCDTFSAAMDRFDRDKDGPRVCGRKVHSAMNAFVDAIAPGRIKQYMSQITEAMIEQPQTCVSLSLVDSRFFKYDNETYMLRAANGYVISLLLNIIDNFDNQAARQHFYQECHLSWARIAMRSNNPALRRFALQTHLVAQCVIKHNPRVVRFQSDFQRTLALCEEGVMTLYWPCLWHRKDIDFVTSCLVVRPITGTTGKGKKPKRSAAGMKRTEIVAYKITLDPPSMHADALDFHAWSRGCRAVA